MVPEKSTISSMTRVALSCTIRVYFDPTRRRKFPDHFQNHRGFPVVNIHLF
ncbi:unnamed protein product [Lupinus luteus]|uniref:Uncharacterized protein n=1 Tax=Lupinus luteus TaxID=3873 RepID=A0AAV1X2K7_LUPLU